MSIILRMQNVQFIHKRGQLLCGREAAADCIIETKSSHGFGFWSCGVCKIERLF